MTSRITFLFFFFLIIGNATSQIQFANRSELLHDQDLHSAVPVAIADMNGDGLDDIVALDEGTDLYVQYQTPGKDRAFVRYTLPVKVANDAQNDIIVADFNNDGANDIFTIGSYDRVKIFYAIPFTYEFESTNMFVVPFFSQGASAGDFNEDGWLDIVVLNDNGLNYTLMNDGTGNLVVQDYFNFVTVPPSDNSGNYGSVYTDFDMDGDNDFYIAKCRQGVNNPADPRRINVLFVNDGNNNYTEDAANYGLASGRQTWTADFGDFDNDGDQDVFMTQHDVISELYENINNDTFINITASAGLNIGGIPLQGMFRDFDNDGFQDILVTGDRIDLYHNNGDKTFSKLDIFGDVVIGTYALGDLNNDGFTDIYASRVIPFNNPNEVREDLLYLNETNDNHFLSLQLVNRGGNPSAIGAQAILYGEWGVQIRDVRAGEQYGVSNAHKMIFGLGEDMDYDSLVIRWPDGLRETYNNLVVDKHWRIEKGNCSSTSQHLWEELGVICGNDSLVLHVDDTIAPVLWSTGSQEDSLVIKTSGLYFATYTNDLGCTVSTTPIEVIMNPDTIRPVLNYSGSTYLCHTDVAVLSVPAFPGYLWSNGETTQEIEVTSSGTYFVEVQGFCIMMPSDSIDFFFLSPEVPVVIPDTFIAGEDAMLFAFGDSIVWYDSMQNVIGTGSDLVLSGLTDTAIVFAANLVPIHGQNFEVGPAGHQGTSKYNGAFINGGLLFEVHKPIVIEEITLFTDSAGVRIIEILQNGEVIFSKEVDLQPGATTITLNASLDIGSYTMSTNTDKNIESFGDASPLLWRTMGGFTYPFEVPTIITISNSTFGDEFYYYFYDWQISTQDRFCNSELVPVTAYFDEMVGIERTTEEYGVDIYPNPTSGYVTIKSDTPLSSLELLDGSGNVSMQLNVVGKEKNIDLDLNQLPQGIYFIKIVQESQVKTSRIIKL